MATLFENTWSLTLIKWKNGTKFNLNFVSACDVKIGKDIHVIFGGQGSLDKVVKINTTEEIAYELEPMRHPRVGHGCELLDDTHILVSVMHEIGWICVLR